MTIPKSMLRVKGEPFVAHQLRLLRDQGIRHVVLCVGYLGEQIRDFVQDGAAFGLSVQFSFDGPVLKGTGGAIRQALPLLGNHFFVMYGDSYLPTSFSRVYERYAASDALGLMTVFRNENRWDKSNVEFGEDRIIRYDKSNPDPAMDYIDYGLGILSDAAFDGWESEDTFDLARVYEALVARGQLAGYEAKERFFEIGSHEGLAEADTSMFHQLKNLHSPSGAFPKLTDEPGGRS
jgi:NDP-sugar pyrophosphorylase family protein